METPVDKSGIRTRGEEAVGELAQALLENPVFSAALGRALGAGERAASAQRSAMGALNVASGSDVERLEQRIRSLSGRLEEVEDRLDDLGLELAALSPSGAALAAERLRAGASKLDELLGASVHDEGARGRDARDRTGGEDRRGLEVGDARPPRASVPRRRRAPGRCRS
jgi:hypothetical protein